MLSLKICNESIVEMITDSVNYAIQIIQDSSLEVPEASFAKKGVVKVVAEPSKPETASREM